MQKNTNEYLISGIHHSPYKSDDTAYLALGTLGIFVLNMITNHDLFRLDDLFLHETGRV